MNTFKKTVLLCICVLTSILSYAQSGNKTASIYGTVKEKGSGKPVEFAVIKISPSEAYTTTNQKGEYAFGNIESGTSEITVQFVGMETATKTIDVVAGKEYRMDFELVETNFRLETVTVVATQNKSGSSTSSEISRQAMDHMQTSSLTDLMGFLPGAALSNPNLSSVNHFNIRTAFDGTGGGTAYGQSMNSLGTSIIVDGAPVSANANLQALSPSIEGASGTTQGGIDARGISTDNIESVEVIRGVPSVEYGDLTSGAVVVHSKAGREPISIHVKANPYTYQAAASGGFSLGENAGIMNVAADYAYSTASLYQAYSYYQRLNLRVSWAKTFGNILSTSTSLNLGHNTDTTEPNPDDMLNNVAANGNENNIRFNTNGTISVNKGWLKTIKYTLSASYADKYDYQQSNFNGDKQLYTTILTDGAVVSNIAGQDVYDIDGNKMTSIPAGDMDKSIYFISKGLTAYEIFGDEINAFAQIKADFNKKWGNINNHILIGVDFKTDGNLGDGKIFRGETPPSYMGAENYASYRIRAYKDIPFINQLGIYAEDTYRHMIGGKNLLNVKLGARYDNINGKSVISPRINASFDIVPETVTARFGWGVNAKAPTVMYLYPEAAYFNISNYISPDDKLNVGTVRSFNTENKDLEIATLRRIEAGIDFKLFGKYSVSVTGFEDRMDNGYSLGRTSDTYKLVPFNRYLAVEDGNGGYAPKFDRTYNIFLGYNTPLNSIKTINRGIEYEIDLGRFNAIRTSFYLNGAYIQSRYTDMSETVQKDNNNTIERDLIVYEGGRYTNAKDKFLTTFRITHNIPELGFVISLVSQVNWMEKYWMESNVADDKLISRWISCKDGVIRDYDYSLADTPEYKYLKGGTFPDNRFTAEDYFPTIFFNIN
ncbi:MAG: TonB-dependent receptor, partial [Bacteroidales bacterium]|nr:TonB-dependent receptor [Bacteroidales bacterium]